MKLDVKVPAVGESISEGILTRWLKANGASVKSGEPLFELETDKVTTEIPAESDGVLTHGAKEGDTVAVGSVVGSIDPSASPASNAPATSATAPPSEAAPAVAPAAAPADKPSDGNRPAASPLARLLAEELKADISKIQGSGPGGRVMKEDVLAATQKAPTPAATTPEPARAPAKPATAASNDNRTERKPMSMLRRRIAERLVESQRTTATLTTFNEIDMSAVMAMRSKYKDAFKERHGVGLGFMSFFVKACVSALKSSPAVNARIDGNDVVYQNFYDIGVAVSTERGLVVPVIRNVDTLTFAEIENAIIDYAKRARDGKIALEELQGGTFTISNGGVFGSLLSTPILNPPQSGILGMHKIEERPIAVNGQVVIRPMMYVALSYDHRIIDGRESVSFLVKVKEAVENPERLLLGL